MALTGTGLGPGEGVGVGAGRVGRMVGEAGGENVSIATGEGGRRGAGGKRDGH